MNNLCHSYRRLQALMHIGSQVGDRRQRTIVDNSYLSVEKCSTVAAAPSLGWRLQPALTAPNITPCVRRPMLLREMWQLQQYSAVHAWLACMWTPGPD